MGIPTIIGFDLSAESALDRRTVVANSAARLALAWVYKGLMVYQVDTDTYYKYIGTPPANTAPDWGTILNTGAAGTPGSVWFDGSGVPSGGLGVNGDYYLENSSGDVYHKVAGVWGVVANIKGPTGASGTSAGDYASLIVTGGATAQSLPNTYTLVTQFVTNGPYTGSVPDAANNKITITNPGDYIFWLHADVLGIVNRQYTLALYVDGVISNVIGTFDCTSNPTPNVAFQLPINIPTGGLVVELYAKASASSHNLTFITGSWGCAALNAKGDTGDAGKALIHTEADITLNDAKVTSVQAGSWTPQDPWSASVASDSRSSYAVPAGITGTKVGHSISYNGTVWSDNGVWRGPTGSAGATGATGATGAAGTPGIIPFVTLAGSGPHVITNKPLAWYYVSPFTGVTNLNINLNGGNAVGTLVTVVSLAPTGVDAPVPSEFDMGVGVIFTTPAASELIYKGRYVTTIPYGKARSITFQMVGVSGGKDQWKVVGEDAFVDVPVTSVNGLTGAVTIGIPSLNDTKAAAPAVQSTPADLTINAASVASQTYGPWTYLNGLYTVANINYTLSGYQTSGADRDFTVSIQYSPDNINWYIIQNTVFRFQQNSISNFSGSATYNGTASTLYYYRVTTAISGGTYRYSNSIQIHITATPRYS